MPEVQLSHLDNRGLDLFVSNAVKSTSSTTTSETVKTPDFQLKFLKTRPKSTPVSFRTAHNASPTRMSRPKTAAAVLGRTTECERVHQLEHEPTRRHNLESHLPIKRSKPPPWQKNMEPLVPFVVGPGYILSRSKSKFAVTLKDEFFYFPQDGEQKKKQEDSDRDALTAQLQQQISDLTLFLEEERLNHRQTKQKAEEYLRDRLEQCHNQHQGHIREIEDKHKEELLQQKVQNETEFEHYRTTTETQINRLVKEIEFLQGAFDSYKSSLHQEMDDRWKKKEEELRVQCEEQTQTAIQEMKTKLVQERNVERATSAKEHNRQMESLRKEHKKELDAFVRRFSGAAADMERLKKTTAELEETQAELQHIQEQYNETCQQLANTTRNLTDAKVRLMDFEERFQEKIGEIDDKYRLKLQDLMSQNTELRRMYVQKCDQLFDEKTMSEQRTMQEVQSAKEALELLIKTKHKANISIAFSAEDLNSQRTPKVRPSSAPGTRCETKKAHLSAGETDHLFRPTEYIQPDHLFSLENPETEKLRQELLATDIRKVTREDLLNSFDV
ncbi:centrosomal protein of 164 kDa-like isoform X2 [Pomacea canaliculata]|uniref:centrosomal protein of 164 kDa-like isoform X2 n=1 Tax=Pomacea canaliculata TaxID=400727 RepID=UPI000D73A14D|nr:centrosomal protein of 164 kDa-like isoform X2 [Pomacea canaliculata]